VHAVVPANRQRYLAEIAETLRDYHRDVQQQSRIARDRRASLRRKECWLRRAGTVRRSIP
jgi:methylmalonyl-CoA mutase